MNDFLNDDLSQLKIALLKKNAQFTADANNIYSYIRKDTAENGQNPYAVVITCSDSRVTPEFIFSETIGSLFVIRSVGNVVGEIELISIEYAMNICQPKCIIIMGHTGCNAVSCAIEGRKDSIAMEIAHAIQDETNHADAVVLNIRHSAAQVKKYPPVRDAVEKKEMIVLEALYDMATGQVNFLD